MKVNIVASRFRVLTDRERAYDMGTRQWRLTNIVLRLATLIPFVHDIELLRDGPPHVGEHRFPRDYDPQNPNSIIPYMFGSLNKIAALGGDVQVYRNTGYSEKWAKSIFPSREKAVVLAIRNADFDTARDSSLDAWYALYKHLSDKGYDVVVIPDQGDALGKNHAAQYPWRVSVPAAMDVELRLALYRNCAMNFAWSSGNTAMLYLSDAAFRIFGVMNSTSPYASEAFLTQLGLPLDQQPVWLKKHQKFMWRDAPAVDTDYLIASADQALAEVAA